MEQTREMPFPLTDAEVDTLVDRCPPENRWAFEGWLRGVRHLDGDLIASEGNEWQ